jgi:hypothetical protein
LRIIIEFGNRKIIIGGNFKMKFKRLSVLLTLMLAFSTFFTTFAFAEENIDKPNLVSLGDSITFGWNLDDTNGNKQKSAKAFPNLIGPEGLFNVTNISGGGWKSSDLITALSAPESIAESTAAISGANVITLDIGSNDLLQLTEVKTVLSPTFPTLPLDQQKQLIDAAKLAALKAGENLYINLSSIVNGIKQLNPEAVIIIYNLYNPIGANAGALHTLGEEVITGINQGVIQRVVAEEDTFLADAYNSFNGKQLELLIPGDVHPTPNGQIELAKLANDILFLSITLTSTPTQETTESVQIAVNTNAKEIVSMRWLKGAQTIENFFKDGSEQGEIIKDSQFNVIENGTYTIYALDSFGRESVQIITIENIKEPVPTPAPTPALTPAPAPVTSAPAPTPQVKATGYAIPNTASPAFNFVAFGSVVLLAGFVTLQVQRRRRQDA